MLLVLIGKSQNFVLAGTVATCGAVVGDLILFRLFRSAKPFTTERPRHADRYHVWWNAMERRISPSWHPMVMGVLIVLILVLPLPNEFADFLLARFRRITTRTMIVISYVGNGIGIYAIVWLAKLPDRGGSSAQRSTQLPMADMSPSRRWLRPGCLSCR